MIKLHPADQLDFDVFADRFAREPVGLVYYPHGLGKGGRPVIEAEARAYLLDYAKMLNFGRRVKSLAGYGLFGIVGLGVSVAFAGWSLAAWWLVVVGTVLIFALVGWAALKPWLFERRLAATLSRRPETAPMSHEERVSRGYAMSRLNAAMFWGLLIPFVVFMLLHRAGPGALTGLFGEKWGAFYHDLGWAMIGLLFAVSPLVIGYAAYRSWSDRQHRG